MATLPKTIRPMAGENRISKTDPAEYRAALIEKYRFLKDSRGSVHELPTGWLFRFGEFCERFQACTWHLADHACPTLRVFVRGDGTFCADCFSGPGSLAKLMAKYERVFEHTCCKCGAAGKGYEVENIREVLCARCAAPHLLLEDLRMLEGLGSSETFAASPVVTDRQIPAALRPEFLRLTQHRPHVRGPAGETLGYFPWDALNWITSLSPLRKEAESALANMKKRARG